MSLYISCFPPNSQYRLESHKLLRNYALQLKEKGITVKAIAMRGDPRDEVLRKAKEVNADMILMGSRGLGMMKRYCNVYDI